ncbi:signal peptide peptidase SppA [uncultured Methanomethylovorans sp.]|uniref:signal peptide peptidase SppA n=1 Tax=uncultured Methanomethylovorans sp. TaxID=183759 RepID=UPI002AA6F3E3|nr:signal peptide peptidase SppA [uncultured Methanomethylovorans sp.]
MNPEDMANSSNTNYGEETPAMESNPYSAEKTERDISASGPTTYTRNTPPPMAPRKSRWKMYLLVAGFLVLLIGVSLVAIMGTFNSNLYSTGDKIAVIYVEGSIVSGSIYDGLGYATPDGINENIRQALEDDSVKAIVLRVDSPGGSSTAGEEIYEEVKKAHDQGMPIVVSMGNVAASAAYHISVPADVIVANPSTMTGSIGVIWTFENMSEYNDKEGIQYYIAKSGEFKDMGGSWRGLTDEEKEYADSVIMEVYDTFVTDVAEGRNMSVSEVKNLADGRIYTGKKAKELGLVDELGNFYDAIDIATKLAGIEGEPTIVYMNKPSLSSLLFGSESQTSNTSIETVLKQYQETPYGHLS